MMTGKNNDIDVVMPFDLLFSQQQQFQEMIEGKATGDDVVKFMYHITSLSEEIGELLKADKRWKTHRNTRYVEQEKLDELADCFITLINISLWSGYNSDDVLKSIGNKIDENFNRVNFDSKNQEENK